MLFTLKNANSKIDIHVFINFINFLLLFCLSSSKIYSKARRNMQWHCTDQWPKADKHRREVEKRLAVACPAVAKDSAQTSSDTHRRRIENYLASHLQVRIWSIVARLVTSGCSKLAIRSLQSGTILSDIREGNAIFLVRIVFSILGTFESSKGIDPHICNVNISTYFKRVWKLFTKYFPYHFLCLFFMWYSQIALGWGCRAFGARLDHQRD